MCIWCVWYLCACVCVKGRGQLGNCSLDAIYLASFRQDLSLVWIAAACQQTLGVSYLCPSSAVLSADHYFKTQSGVKLKSSRLCS